MWQDVCQLLRQPERLEAEYERRLQSKDDAFGHEPEFDIAAGATETWHRPADRRLRRRLIGEGGIRAEGSAAEASAWLVWKRRPKV